MRKKTMILTRTRKVLRRLVVFVLLFGMVCNTVVVCADDVTEQETELVETEESTDEIEKPSIDEADPADEMGQSEGDALSENPRNPEEADSDDDGETEDAEDDSAVTDSKPFSEEKTLDGVTVSVSADAGVIPNEASLSVSEVGNGSKNAVKKAMDKVRDDGWNVADSYTFDISLYDAEGNKVEPDTSIGAVKLTFDTDLIANDNLETVVYHMADGGNGAVEKLNVVDKSSSSVTVETNGFSYYTVEFTYEDLWYVLSRDSVVELADILAEVGLSGNITKAESSNLLAVEQKNGGWGVTAKEALSSDEWLKVTIDGVEYEILVTDEQSGTETAKSDEDEGKAGFGDGAVETDVTDDDDEEKSNRSLDTKGQNKSGMTSSKKASKASVAAEGVVEAEKTEIVESGKCGENVFWELDEDGVLTIHGTGDMYDYENGSPFGYDSDYVYVMCRQIDIKEGVTSIGSNAFSFLGVRRVKMPDSIVRIGDGAFSDCINLVDLRIPNNVNTIGKYAFSQCSSLNIECILDEIKIIEERAFYNCRFKTLELPNVEEIGKEAFGVVTGDKMILGNIRKIENEAFAGARFDEICISGENIEFGENVFGGCDLEKITILSGVSEIPSYMFENLRLKQINIEGVTKIGDYSFKNCENLKNIDIPSSVIEIGQGAFRGSGLINLSIPENVNVIDEEAFSWCTKLENVYIYNGVKEIGESAFEYCTNLSKVVILEGLEKISKDAFSNCNKIISVQIPKSLTDVDYNAFPLQMESYMLTDRFHTPIRDVYFSGSEQDWETLLTKKNVKFSFLNSQNTFLDDVGTIHYNTDGFSDGRVHIYGDNRKIVLSVDGKTYNGLTELPTFTYDGTEKYPEVTVYIEENDSCINLENGVDYSLKYIDNLNPGEATVQITGLGKYKGIEIRKFIIEEKSDNEPEDKVDISSAEIELLNDKFEYNGRNRKPIVVVSFNKEILHEEIDYMISGSKPHSYI